MWSEISISGHVIAIEGKSGHARVPLFIFRENRKKGATVLMIECEHSGLKAVLKHRLLSHSLSSSSSLSLSLSLSLWLFLSFSRALNNGSGRMNCFRRKAISVNTTWARTVECLPDLIFGGTTVITSISSCYTTCVLARRCARLMSWSKEISKWNFYAGSIAFLQLGSSAYSYPFYFFRSNVRDILKQVQQSPTVVVIFCKFPQRSF